MCFTIFILPFLGFLSCFGLVRFFWSIFNYLHLIQPGLLKISLNVSQIFLFEINHFIKHLDWGISSFLHILRLYFFSIVTFVWMLLLKGSLMIISKHNCHVFTYALFIGLLFLPKEVLNIVHSDLTFLFKNTSLWHLSVAFFFKYNFRSEIGKHVFCLRITC